MVDDPKQAQDPYAEFGGGGGTATKAADDPYAEFGGTAASPQTTFRSGTPLPPPPKSVDTTPESGVKKFARGAALGAAESVAAPGQVDPNEPFFSSKNAISGVKATRDMYAKAGADAVSTGGLSIPIGIVKGLYGAADEAWQNRFQNDPEAYGHALGSAGAQLLMLRSAAKGVKGENVDKPTADIASGLGITGKIVDAFRKSGVVNVLQDAGVKTIGGALDAVGAASKHIDQTFNQGLAQIGNSRYLPVEIKTRILGMITPDMAKTAEGRAAAAYLRNRAREYDQPWTLNQLNAKRMTENNNLESFYNNDSRGQAAAAIDAHISKAIRDGAAEIVYDQAERTGAIPNARALKQQQGGLWAMKDHIMERISDLDAKQMAKASESGFDKLKPRVSIGESGKARGYVAGLADSLLSGDPKKAADAKVSRGANAGLLARSPVSAWPVVGLLSRDGTIDDGTKQYERGVPAPPAKIQ